MNVSRASILWAVFLVGWGGCSRAEPKQEGSPSEAPVAERPPSPSPPGSPEASERVWARVTRVRGEGDGIPSPGTVLLSDTSLRLPEGSEVVIDFPDGERLELFGPAHATLLRAGASILLLARGEARGFIVPSSRPPREPLRIATPATTVELGRSGDVWVAAGDDGRTIVGQLAGVSDSWIGDGSVRNAVSAGEALRVHLDGKLDTLTGRTRLDEVRALAPKKSNSSAGTKLPRASFSALRDAAVAALVALEGERARGVALIAEHRAAVATGKSAPPELRASLVAHSKALLERRTALERSWERLRAFALFVADAEAAAEIERLRARVSKALSSDPH